MLIRDLVTLNEEADLVNDVQLSWYPNDPRNRTLAKGYIFTDKAPQGKKSSIALLEQVRDAFIYNRENRFVVIANYGHGKTHFALALANFFGKSADTEEVRQMLDNIAHASTESKAQGLRDFKEGRSPYLAVRLRGDKPGSLSQQFVTGLEAALDEHEETRGEHLPLWFDAAGKFLGRLTPEQRDAADAFLKTYESDTELLLRQVRERVADRYDLCRALSRELYGAALDFGSEVSVEQVVKMAADAYCGPGKPFAGLLTLFDEFSEFIKRYAERHGAGSSSLQDLLDGIHSRQERTAFVAFSQHDPDTVAQNIFRLSADPQGQESLSKELNRLPMPQRQTLFSSLETVLAAYLKQNIDNWQHFDDQVAGALDDATDCTMDLMKDNYADSLGWDTETISDILTHRCFPLHPMTTALLCNVRLREVTNPRAVLGFVQEALEGCLDQQALSGHFPNWVHAVNLVDYFGEMLADKEWEQYQGAVGNLSGDITEPQACVLKAMLLIAIASLKTRALGYSKVASLLTGMTLDECQGILSDLSERGYIFDDATNKKYSFWTAGASGNRLDKEIKKYLSPSLNIDNLNKEWAGSENATLASMEVNGVVWGSAKDYETSQFLLTRATFTVDRLRREASLYKADSQAGMIEGIRGGLFWLVAESESDIEWFQENAKIILDEALSGDHPPPIVLALPSVARPNFTAHILRLQALQRLPQEVRHEYGAEVQRSTAIRYQQAIDDDMRAIKGAAQFVVSAPYRVSLAQQGPARTAARVLEICYQAAYNSAPRAFFTQYRVTHPNLCKAVSRISDYLSQNRLAMSVEVQRANPVAGELISKYLRVGLPSSWGLVTGGNDIQPPTAQRMRVAWNMLDEAFKPGEPPHSIRDVLIKLYNPPFGYDDHHVLLLFSAWYGFHQQYLVMQNGAQRTSLGAILHNQDKPRDIILALCRAGVALSRKDKDETEKELMALVHRMSQEIFTRSKAQEALAELSALAKEEDLPDNLRTSVVAARERVERGLKRANEYTETAEALQMRIERDSDVANLVQHYERVGKLPKLLCVETQAKISVTNLQKIVMSRLNEALETQCQKYKQLKSLEDYGLHKNALDKISGELVAIGKPELRERVNEAREALDEKREILRKGSELKQQDSEIVAELRSMQDHGPIVHLRQSLGRLEEFTPRAPETIALIQQKQAALQNQIASLEQFVSDLPARLDKVSDGAQAHQVNEGIQRRYNAFTGAEEQADLEAALKRSADVEKVLNNLASYRRRIAQLETPKAVEELRSSVMRLKDLPILSEPQKAQFVDLEAELDHQYDKGRKDALAWLEDCQQQVRKSDASSLVALLEKLDRPHMFLPASEEATLIALREQVQQSLDQNEVEAITLRFQRISDPQKRRACLEALQRMACLEEIA